MPSPIVLRSQDDSGGQTPYVEVSRSTGADQTVEPPAGRYAARPIRRLSDDRTGDVPSELRVTPRGVPDGFQAHDSQEPRSPRNGRVTASALRPEKPSADVAVYLGCNGPVRPARSDAERFSEVRAHWALVEASPWLRSAFWSRAWHAWRCWSTGGVPVLHGDHRPERDGCPCHSLGEGMTRLRGDLAGVRGRQRGRRSAD